MAPCALGVGLRGRTGRCCGDSVVPVELRHVVAVRRHRRRVPAGRERTRKRVSRPRQSCDDAAVACGDANRRAAFSARQLVGSKQSEDSLAVRTSPGRLHTGHHPSRKESAARQEPGKTLGDVKRPMFLCKAGRGCGGFWVLRLAFVSSRCRMLAFIFVKSGLLLSQPPACFSSAARKWSRYFVGSSAQNCGRKRGEDCPEKKGWRQSNKFL